jgi:hypothetical protein
MRNEHWDARKVVKHCALLYFLENAGSDQSNVVEKTPCSWSQVLTSCFNRFVTIAQPQRWHRRVRKHLHRQRHCDLLSIANINVVGHIVPDNAAKLAQNYQSVYLPGVAHQPAAPVTNASGSYYQANYENLSLQTSQIPPSPDSKNPSSAYTLLTPPYVGVDVTLHGRPSLTRESSTQSTPTSQALQTSPISMTATEAQPRQDAVTATKPKRVRTGCLTCRERHLKCDESLPNCQNCTKSNRQCKRGVRLNFIDIQCERPPHLLPPTHDWEVTFQDDSRAIASEYRGGLEKYHPLEPEPKRQRRAAPDSTYNYSQANIPGQTNEHFASQHAFSKSYTTQAPTLCSSVLNQSYPSATDHSNYYEQTQQEVPQSYQSSGVMSTDPNCPCLEDASEVLYLQVFVEEVALWMDSMDPEKHFSRIIPFQALKEPMLRSSVLACGVRHLTLVNSIVYREEEALRYYNSATQLLLRALQNPDRDSVLCATTATILNVYEVMSERALQRMNHIAGARALIKECGWNARSQGIGAACFWLNVGLEVFSCMHFNWSVAWDPETWGVDFDVEPQLVPGDEEGWSRKMLWIVAMVTNFRAESQRRYPDASIEAEQMRLQQREQKWRWLRSLCDRWNSCAPPTMQPLSRVPPYMAKKRSAFPELWFIKRATITGRLFYYTAMAALGATHPMINLDPQTTNDMHEMKIHHSRQICGIVAHVKDRGVASAAIRCLAVAGENLSLREEQQEVLQIYDRIKEETGWRVAFIKDDLKEKWGWNSQGSEYDNMSTPSNSAYLAPSATPTPPAQSGPRYPRGIVNPLYKNADFSAQNPPYQGSYVPPASTGVMHNYPYQGIASI